MNSMYFNKGANIKTGNLDTLFLYILIAVMILSCGNNTVDSKISEDDYPEYEAIQEITYHYGAASVSPEYHRSYSIIIATDSIRVIVDSYSDTLANEKYNFTVAQFESVISSLRNNGIKSCTLGNNDDCTGGTSETVSCSDGSDEIFSGKVYHCQDDTGNLCGNIVAFANDVKSLAPNLDSLLQ